MAVEDTDTSSTGDESSADENINLEDIEVTEDELKEINRSEDSEDEPENNAEKDEPEQSDESQEESQDESKDESEAEADEKSEPSEAERKAYNKMMAEKRIQEKQQREATILESQKEYITQAEDEKDAAIRQLQVEAYNTKVEGLTNKLTNGYERAIKDFPILTNQSPEIQAEVSDAIAAFEAKFVKIDSFGNPSEVKADLYEYLQTKADSIDRLTKLGARQQVDNKVAEKSKTFTPPSRTPKEPKVDPEMEAFLEEAYK